MGDLVKNKLKTECQKKIDTTMIGALSAIEDAFGELWNHQSLYQNEDELFWKEKYEILRSKILDNGNNQKRKLEKELESYEVSLRRYHVDLPVKSRNLGGYDEGRE